MHYGKGASLCDEFGEKQAGRHVIVPGDAHLPGAIREYRQSGPRRRRGLPDRDI